MGDDPKQISKWNTWLVEAVRKIRMQKQKPNLDRIFSTVRHVVEKEQLAEQTQKSPIAPIYNPQVDSIELSQVEKHLNRTVKEGILVRTISKGEETYKTREKCDRFLNFSSRPDDNIEQLSRCVQKVLRELSDIDPGSIAAGSISKQLSVAKSGYNLSQLAEYIRESHIVNFPSGESDTTAFFDGLLCVVLEKEIIKGKIEFVDGSYRIGSGGKLNTPAPSKTPSSVIDPDIKKALALKPLDLEKLGDKTEVPQTTKSPQKSTIESSTKRESKMSSSQEKDVKDSFECKLQQASERLVKNSEKAKSVKRETDLLESANEDLLTSVVTKASGKNQESSSLSSAEEILSTSSGSRASSVVSDSGVERKAQDKETAVIQLMVPSFSMGKNKSKGHKPSSSSVNTPFAKKSVPENLKDSDSSRSSSASPKTVETTKTPHVEMSAKAANESIKSIASSIVGKKVRNLCSLMENYIRML